jgi:hypothetical protein
MNERTTRFGIDVVAADCDVLHIFRFFFAWSAAIIASHVIASLMGTRGVRV